MRLRHPDDVVGDVAEERRRLLGHERHRAGREPLHRLAQRVDRAAHLGELALEDVDPLGVLGAVGENTDASTSSTSSSSEVGHLLVVVDDLVADRVDDRRRAVAEHGGLLLEVEPGVVQLGALAVPDADDEVAAHEQVDLAGLDGVVLVDVPERLEDQEQPVVVALELGPLVGLEGVLDGQRVQARTPRRRASSSSSAGSCRPTQTKSPSPVASSRTACRSSLAQSTAHADAVAVERAVDDHAAQGTCPTPR